NAVGVELFKEGAVHRCYAQGKAAKVCLFDRLINVQVERNSVTGQCQEPGVHFFIVELVDVLPAPILAKFIDGVFAKLDTVSDRKQVRVERTGNESHINNTGLDRVTDLERRHSSRAAHHVDLHQALAFGVDLLDKARERSI